MDPGSQHPDAQPARASGLLESATGAGCNDHACWAYSSRPERDAAAVEWLLDGARLGQRLFVVTGDEDGGERLLAAIARADPQVARAVANFDIDQLYDRSAPIDAHAQLALYSQEVARAVADGFNGIRVFCDITPLIADPNRRASHAHWEHVADAWMAEGNPLAPLCAYDVGVIGDRPQAFMALHPLRHGPDGAATTFGLFCESSTTKLGGEVDVFGVSTLASALDALPAGPHSVDVGELSYLCCSAAATLAAAGTTAATEKAGLSLLNAPPFLRRIWHILDFDMRMLPDDRDASKGQYRGDRG